jgi:hypothetical protein
VAGRSRLFSDSNVVETATNDFVAVVGDDWYQRRRRDAEGEFYRKVIGQRNDAWDGDSTRQGFYLFTAQGQLLVEWRNSLDPRVLRDLMARALRAFRELPESERTAVVADRAAGTLDPTYHREPPEGVLILRAHSRLLERDEAGVLRRCSKPSRWGLGLLSARDHVWLPRPEWRSLIPEAPKVGASFDPPASFVERICRFHLVDNTRGEPAMWGRDEIRSARLTLTVTQATDERVAMRLEGEVLIHTEAGRGQRGFEARLIGELAVDRKKGAFERFDVVAIGEHWGESRTDDAREGRSPLGIAFELVTGDAPADRVPPQGARWLAGYLDLR